MCDERNLDIFFFFNRKTTLRLLENILYFLQPYPQNLFCLNNVILNAFHLRHLRHLNV